MRLLGTTMELTKEFKRLLKNYKEYLWTVAWADFDFELSKLLVSKKSRIQRISVGLQFYGTHPSFLKEFYTHPGVRFLEQTKGTYHPKLYLFRNSTKNWELLIGSGNYTAAAFGNNTEASILISSTDKISNDVYESAIKFIDNQWKNGKILTEKYVNEYKEKKSKVKTYIPRLPASGSRQPVFEKTWLEYLGELKSENGYQNRIKFLNWVHHQFSKYRHFEEMELKTRQSIAGFGQGEEDVDIGCFGTTGARYSFMNKVNKNPAIISKALNQIPKKGEVSKTNYQNYIKKFRKVSPHQELASATRLLCLWRPDYFINFNGKNENAMCKELQIKKSQVNYNTYWDLIVQPFINSDWTFQTKKMRKTELEIYNYRVALLDCIYYKWE